MMVNNKSEMSSTLYTIQNIPKLIIILFMYINTG
jgi:hypothetical protein